MKKNYWAIERVICVGWVVGLFFIWDAFAQEFKPKTDSGYTLSGWVFDETPDISDEALSALEELSRAKNRDELEAMIHSFKSRISIQYPEATEKELKDLDAHFAISGKGDTAVVNIALELWLQVWLGSGSSPPMNAGVTLCGDSNSIMRETILGTDGHFVFENLPTGHYRLTIEASPRVPAPHTAIGYAHLHLTNDVTNLKIPISAYPVILRGRVRTENGIPFTNAVVKGVPFEKSDLYPYPGFQYKHENAVEVKTNDQGEYELSGFIPEPIFIFAMSLGGKKSLRSGVTVFTDMDGYEQKASSHIPLTTIELLPAARRIFTSVLAVMSRFDMIDENDYPERTDLPKSEGNVIFVEDIILKRVDEPGEIKIP